jgi:hypothetical protein
MNSVTHSSFWWHRLVHRAAVCVCVYMKTIRDISVGIATGYRLDGRVRFPVGAGDFSLLHSLQIDSGANPTSHPMGTVVSFPEAKRPGRETEHSPLPSAEFKNGGAVPPPSYSLRDA